MSIKKPSWLPNDKLIHFFVGTMMSPWLIIDAGFSVNLGFIGWVICLVVALVIKELIYDLLLGKGNFEVMDVAWTMITPTIFLIINIIQQL